MSTHHLTCHCGAVSVDAEFELENLATCNCSLCGRSGAIMVFVLADKLSNIVGEDKLTDYQFGKRSIHHGFCSTCGVRPFARGLGADGQAWAMVNVRCLDGVDVHTLEIERTFDGKAL